MSKRKQLCSDIAWRTETKITVKGKDLCNEVLGKVSLGDMAFLEMMDRLPTSGESVMFNAISVALAEHGMTPSAIVARLTLASRPRGDAGGDRSLFEWPGKRFCREYGNGRQDLAHKYARS